MGDLQDRFGQSTLVVTDEARYMSPGCELLL
jgi:hypothetical protein